jgi:rod shape-determining protein MreC
MTIPIISSIPARIDQTQPEIIEPVAPAEHIVPPKKATKKKLYKKKRKKPVPRSVDLF